MSSWSIYDGDTGRFTGKTIIGTPATLAANLRGNLVAMPGRFDPQRHQVDIATGRVNPREPDAPSDTALARAARAERDRRLAAADVAVLRVLELGQAVPAHLLAYRAALRSLPQAAGFPRTIDWPEAPTS